MKLYEILEKGYELLSKHNVPDYKVDGDLLWQYASGMDKSSMLLERNKEIPEELADNFMDIIKKRCSRYPLQYITGVQNFMGYDFATSENVLIPRQDTEILVEQALNILDGKRGTWLSETTDIKHDWISDNDLHTIRVLDLCCGTGCIGLSLKLLKPDIELTLADISDAAIDIAGRNARSHNIDCNIIQSDLFQNIDDGYDMIVSNPPYIKSQVIDELMPEVRDYEPRLALDGSEDGLLYYRRIIEEAGEYLRNGGYLLFEIGNDQAYEVLQLLVDGHFIDCRKVQDLAGNDRVVIAKKL